MEQLGTASYTSFPDAGGQFTIPHHKTLELHKSKNLLLLWFTILANLPTEIKYSTSVIKVDEPYLLVGFSTLIPLALIRV
jgi:hypothetical protein